MLTRSLERKFLRFRQKGDPAALAAVFDRTAAEVLKVAMHLSRDPAEAEDLVQRTFLTAIERSASFDARERLVPWLLGILSNHARESARTARRTIDPTRLRTQGAADPSAVAAEVEGADEVGRAIDALPDPYRSVLVLRFRHGMEPAEIANALGLPPGTVRSHIHRGLERVKRVVPVGLAGGVLLDLPISHGLQVMRQQVLAQAQVAAVTTAGSVATAAAVTGGVLVGKKVLVTGALLLLLGGTTAWWVGRDGFLGRDLATAPQPSRQQASEEGGVGSRGLDARPSAAHQAALSRSGPPENGTGEILGILHGSPQPVGAKVELRWLASNRELQRSESGSAVSDLSVREPGAVTGTAVADAEGRFGFQALPAGVWELTVTGIDGMHGTARVQLAPEGAHRQVDLWLSAGTETLDGRVVFEDGRPWTGAVLLGTSLRGSDEIYLPRLFGSSVGLDKDGRFHLTGLAPGPAFLTAVSLGSLAVSGGQLSLPYDGEYLLRVPLPGTVVGRVVADADGKGIPGAEVYGTGMAEGGTSYVSERAVTDETGRFALALPGSGRISARASGYAGGVRRVLPGSKNEIRLSRPARLEGRVTSTAGKGVEGLAVRLNRPRDDSWAFTPEDATTDVDGRFAFTQLEPGDVVVLASGNGWTTRGAAETRMDGFNPFRVHLDAGSTVTFDLVVARGASLVGRALDPDGRPLRGASVYARRLSLDMDMTLYGWFRGLREVATTADGTFRLEGLDGEATYRLSARSPGFALDFVDATTSERGAQSQVDLRLAPTRAVLVSVIDDAEGTPIPGAQVYSTYSPMGGRVPSTWWTGSDGRVSISPIGDSELQMSVSAAGYQPSALLNVSTSSREVTARLKPGRDLRGRVLGPDGTPAAGVRVRCIPPQSVAVTSSDGTFRFRGLGEGPVQLQATTSIPRVLRAQISIESGRTDAVLTLAEPPQGESSRTLVVRVVDTNGAPVHAAHVDFTWKSNSPPSTTGSSADAIEGVARFAGLVDRGEGTIRVSRARGIDGAPLPLSPAKVPIVAASASEIVVTLPPGISISGQVHGPDGKGLSGVPVHALTEDEMQTWGRRGVRNIPKSVGVLERTDADGSFRLEGLADVPHLLGLDVPPDLLLPEPLRVEGQRTNVQFQLKPGVIANVKILDPDGSPVRSACVSLHEVGSQGAGPLFSEWTLGSGVVRFTSMDPTANYRLEVQVPSNRAQLVAPTPTEPWSPRDEVVTLLRATSIQGTVVDSEGRPVPSALVWWMKDATSQPGMVIAASDGSFEIPHLPTGSIRLRADVLEGSLMDPLAVPAWTEASPGDPKVKLTIDLGLALDVLIENWPRGAFSPGQSPPRARLTREGTKLETSVLSPIASDGRIRFRGLRSEDKYTLWIGPVLKSFVLQRGLSAGQAIRARLVEGASITVRLEGAPQDATWIGVIVDSEGLSGDGEKAEDGRYVIRGLPPGRWRVRAFARTENAPQLSATGEASTGDEITLRLQDQPRPR